VREGNFGERINEIRHKKYEYFVNAIDVTRNVKQSGSYVLSIHFNFNTY
jgi:hypothetical protein